MHILRFSWGKLDEDKRHWEAKKPELGPCLGDISQTDISRGPRHFNRCGPAG